MVNDFFYQARDLRIPLMTNENWLVPEIFLLYWIILVKNFCEDFFILLAHHWFLCLFDPQKASFICEKRFLFYPVLFNPFFIASLKKSFLAFLFIEAHLLLAFLKARKFSLEDHFNYWFLGLDCIIINLLISFVIKRTWLPLTTFCLTVAW